ncbi:hypothetical protein [Myroides odoratimimus]|uniref:Uncharacterized protein n=1 Tax=Myroides odoratimimus CIP 101113 TaxID=883154 RepID=A0AAV3F027_9FLAO|nr:hypothetical protein [Myroides odoratimimus]EHO07931.1 hypothetical protein HMPREF9715_02797 [Myroides odoratimimus CIP 101113]
MTSIKNHISSLSIPCALKENLQKLTIDENYAFYFIFYSESNLLTLPTITIAGSGNVFEELINQDWVIHSVDLYNVIINLLDIDALIEYQLNSQKMYSHLNCQLDQLVFQAEEDHDGYLGLHFMKKTGNAYLEKTRKWLETRSKNHLNKLDEYITNIGDRDSNYVIIVNALKQLLKEVLIDFTTIFFPPSLLQMPSEEEVLNFLLKHSKILEKYDWPQIDTVRKYRFQKSNPPIQHLLYIINFDKQEEENNKYEITLLIDIIRVFISVFSTTLLYQYKEEYKKRTKQLKIYNIREEAKASVESWEETLENQVKETLKTFYRPKSVFLLSKKYFNIPLTDLNYERGIQLFIVVLTHKRTYQEIRQFNNAIAKKTKGRVKVTVLLQKESDWVKNLPEFFEFYKKYFTDQNLFYGNSFYINYKTERYFIDNNKKQYNKECLESINLAYLNIKENSNAIFCEAQTMLYHFVIQQSLVLLIYKKLDLIPNIIELSYLWDLIQWCYPSVYKDINDLPAVKRILFNKDCFVKSYPKSNDYIINCTLEDIKELDSFCDMIYSFAKEEVKDSSLIIELQ